MKLLLITETLRIGGIERNTLDQAYQLSDRGDKVIILVLDHSATFDNVNFVNIENILITEKKLDIRYSNKGIVNQICYMTSILKEVDFDVIIDYTLSGTLKVRLASLYARKIAVIHTVVQQLTSLSTRKQKYKRFFYAQFATRLFMNSVNYGRDWDFYKESNVFSSLVFRKKYNIIRNGVYLPRLEVSTKGIYRKNSENLRLIFLGRLKIWKGLNNFVKIDNALKNNVNFLVLASEKDDDVVKNLKSMFGNRIEFIFGTTMSDFIPSEGDVHFYPVDYGTNSHAIESVSTNCLEMALLGVPSIVTEGGVSNWMELRALGLVHEINWENEDSILEGIDNCKQINISSNEFEIMANAINIESNLIAHFKYL
jgi:glycosyltransferase involved in cell wall biosynthesis